MQSKLKYVRLTKVVKESEVNTTTILMDKIKKHTKRKEYLSVSLH